MFFLGSVKGVCWAATSLKTIFHLKYGMLFRCVHDVTMERRSMYVVVHRDRDFVSKPSFSAVCGWARRSLGLDSPFKREVLQQALLEDPAAPSRGTRYLRSARGGPRENDHLKQGRPRNTRQENESAQVLARAVMSRVPFTESVSLCVSSHVIVYTCVRLVLWLCVSVRVCV